MNSIETDIKLYTGAELNIIPVDLFKQFKNVTLSKSNIVIESLGGFTIKSKRNIEIELESNDLKIKRIFEVVEYVGLPLLSYEPCVNMKLKIPEVNEIKTIFNSREKNNFIKNNKEVFEGTGKFPEKVKIKIKENASPVSNPPRTVSIKIHDKLKEQLNKIVKLD